MRPRALTATENAATAVGDVSLAVMLALMLPLGLILLLSPVAVLVRVILTLAGLL